jgi:hypothetical protein
MAMPGMPRTAGRGVFVLSCVDLNREGARPDAGVWRQPGVRRGLREGGLGQQREKRDCKESAS